MQKEFGCGMVSGVNDGTSKWQEKWRSNNVVCLSYMQVNNKPFDTPQQEGELLKGLKRTFLPFRVTLQITKLIGIRGIVVQNTLLSHRVSASTSVVLK